MSKFISIDPGNISYKLIANENNTTARMYINKEGIPEGAKKVYALYMYIDQKEDYMKPEQPKEIESLKTELTSGNIAVSSPLQTNEWGISLEGSLIPTKEQFSTYKVV